MPSLATTTTVRSVRRRILAWYAADHRELPFRRSRDPWPVLVAEVMLQQTQAARIAERFDAFMDRYPTPTVMAEPDRKVRSERLEQLLSEFHIERLRDAPAMALSGGERRRCEIARALAADPSIMLLDEPFAGIDPISISDIRDLVIELKKRDIGVLITDHNVRETLEIVDRACIIYDGQVLFAGSPEALVANEDVRRLYLGESFEL